MTAIPLVRGVPDARGAYEPKGNFPAQGGVLLLLAAAAWLYSVVLPLEGRLLQRREQAILREVTEEVE